MKQTTLVTRLVLMLVMVGTLVLAGCGGNDNGVSVEMVEVPAEPPEVTVEVPAASEIEGVQQKAANAAAAAMTASDNAAMAAMAAKDATANLATMQTGAMSGMMAYAAKDAAAKAMTAYMDAKMASEAAMEATTTEAATESKLMAEAAQMDAEKYGMMASESSEGAVKYAAMELMIDGTMKSVGETTIDAMAGASTMTTGSGDDERTVMTGLIKDDTPKTTGLLTDGRAPIAAMFADETEYMSPVAGAALRDDLEIGKVVDSVDDTARLQIITAYADTKTVKGYALDTATTYVSDEEGMIHTDSNVSTIPDGAVLVRLRSAGMFYLALGGAVGNIEGLDIIGDTAEADEVFSFVDTSANTSVTRYVVINNKVETTTSGETTTTLYTYNTASIYFPVDRDGITGVEDVFVTAELPAAKPYDYVHFGVWAALGEAAKDGSQEVDGLGIGFVQNFSGMGMTENMLNRGDATYEGNWVATVQEAAGDDVTLEHNVATLTADFDKATLEADLIGLAVLTGDLSGSAFSGTKAAVKAGNAYNLNASGKFTGEFSGGFYGDGAVEAGGIFDFSSASEGAFVGAFGGRIEKEE